MGTRLSRIACYFELNPVFLRVISNSRYMNHLVVSLERSGKWGTTVLYLKKAQKHVYPFVPVGNN